MNPRNETYLTVEEVAIRLGLRVAALDKRRQRGQAPPFVKFGKTVKYRLSDIEAWEREAAQDGNCDVE